VDEALDAVGLRDREREDVTALSGGQQRRVLIARALASRPDLLVMDEPTAGVDAANQRILAEVLAVLAARGTSMLIVTHELAALHDVVTRIVCMDGGHVDYDGTPHDYVATHRGHEAGTGHHHDESPATEGRTPGITAIVRDPLGPREVHHG
jgi:zinc transport system ATP-binding protein